MSEFEFEITQGPSIWKKDYVVLKSLPDLQRLCHLFNIPLLHMPKAQFYVGNVPAGNADSYNIFFAYMSGLYYTYTEQNEDTRGASS